MPQKNVPSFCQFPGNTSDQFLIFFWKLLAVLKWGNNF